MATKLTAVRGWLTLWRNDRGLALLGTLAVLWAAFAAPLLLYPDLNLDYPFLGGDSHDWIANGLKLAGDDVRYSGRSPLLPLAVALLDRTGLLPALPWLLEGLFLVTLLAFYRTAAALTSRPAALIVGVALLGSHAIAGAALEVMADLPASCLLFWAVRAFFAAGEDPRRYRASGLWAGLAALTQQAALLWPLPALATVATLRRPHLRAPALWIGGALFLLPQAAWIAVRRLAFSGNFLGHWRLLVPHAGSVGFYLWSAAALFGWPACLLALLGAVRAARRVRTDARWALTLALAAALLGFFVFLYDYNAPRLLLHALWPLGLLIALGLTTLSYRPAAVMTAILLVAIPAIPRPDGGQLGQWATLWPLPALVGQASFAARADGSPELRAIAPQWQRARAAELAAWSQPARLLAARRQWRALPPLERRPARDFAGDRRVLFLYQEGEESRRYRILDRLGNAVRRRVQLVPLAFLAGYGGRLTAVPAGAIDHEYFAWQVTVQGLDGRFLCVTSRPDPFLVPLPPAPAPAPLPSRALALARFVEPGSAYLGIFPPAPPDDPAALDLLFLVDRPDIYVFMGEERQRAAQRLAAAPRLDDRRWPGVRARRVFVLGQPATIVSFQDERQAAPWESPAGPAQPRR